MEELREREREINNRVKLAWMRWKHLTGVLRDKKVPIKMKEKSKKDETRLYVAEMRMLRWIGGIRPERIMSEIRS